MKRFLSALGILLLLSACTPKNTSPSTTSTSGSGVYQFHVWVDRDEDFWNSIAAEFLSQTRTTGVRVKVIPFDDEALMTETLFSLMAEGKGPDVILADGQWIAEHRTKLLPAPTAAGLSASLFRSTFVRATHDVLVGEDQRIYGMPLGVETLGVWYNVDHLIDRLPSRNEPSSTWQGLIDDVSTLNRKDNSLERFAISGAALGRSDTIRHAEDILQNLWLQMGVTLFTPDGTTSVLSSSQSTDTRGQRVSSAVESLDYYTQYADDRYKQFSWTELMADENGTLQDLETFLTGRASLYFGYSSELQDMQAILSSSSNAQQRMIPLQSIRAASLPQATTGTETRQLLGHVKALVVPRSAERPELSWNFVNFLATEENQRLYHEKTHTPTARLSLITEFGQDPTTGAFDRQAKFASFVPIPLNYGFWKQSLDLAIDRVNRQVLTPTQAVRQLESELNATLRTRAAIDSAVQKENRTSTLVDPGEDNDEEDD